MFLLVFFLFIYFFLYKSSVNARCFQSRRVIVFNNRDLNIDVNNRDHDFSHDRAALALAALSVTGYAEVS